MGERPGFRIKKYVSASVAVCLCWQLAAQAPKAPEFPPGEAGFEAMTRFLLESPDSIRLAFTLSMLPGPADFYAVFDSAFALKAMKHQRRMARRYDLTLRPLLPGQSLLSMYRTTSDELREYTESAREFPGGYREIADYFKPGVELFRFRFHSPDQRLGSAYDLFIYLDGRWRYFVRPWMAASKRRR